MHISWMQLDPQIFVWKQKKRDHFGSVYRIKATNEWINKCVRIIYLVATNSAWHVASSPRAWAQTLASLISRLPSPVYSTTPNRPSSAICWKIICCMQTGHRVDTLCSMIEGNLLGTALNLFMVHSPTSNGYARLHPTAAHPQISCSTSVPECTNNTKWSAGFLFFYEYRDLEICLWASCLRLLKTRQCIIWIKKVLLHAPFLHPLTLSFSWGEYTRWQTRLLKCVCA